MEFYDYDIDLDYTSYFNMQIITSLLSMIGVMFPWILAAGYMLFFTWDWDIRSLEMLTMITSAITTLFVLYVAYNITADTEAYILKIKNERAELLSKIKDLEKKKEKDCNFQK